MWRALKSKNKITFVDGSIQRPPKDDMFFEAWDRCNTQIVSWINHSLNLEIAQSVMWINSAEELWEELRYRYNNGDVYRIAELEEELFATKQGDVSVTTYYTILKSIWEELENLRPISSCSRYLEKCNCELSIMRGYKEESEIVRFLRGLNDHFSTVRSQIMLSKPLPKVDVAFVSLLQQERQLNMNEGMEEKALLVENNAKAGRGSKQCIYCCKNSHLADTCYKSMAFPLISRTMEPWSIIWLLKRTMMK
ncbi:uncharacterized protein LOC107640100 [Arachis ipaensis]|uniref:uncharacterized protein LOC107640100 n=1 Tax=Arachis ipaensis TaxID=130454 RepID=UPI000A2B6F84|nr:uncharacterized protein LOC107640100 [Arachis ipaensis]